MGHRSLAQRDLSPLVTMYGRPGGPGPLPHLPVETNAALRSLYIECFRDAAAAAPGPTLAAHAAFHTKVWGIKSAPLSAVRTPGRVPGPPNPQTDGSRQHQTVPGGFGCFYLTGNSRVGNQSTRGQTAASNSAQGSEGCLPPSLWSGSLED